MVLRSIVLEDERTGPALVAVHLVLLAGAAAHGVQIANIRTYPVAFFWRLPPIMRFGAVTSLLAFITPKSTTGEIFRHRRHFSVTQNCDSSVIGYTFVPKPSLGS